MAAHVRACAGFVDLRDFLNAPVAAPLWAGLRCEPKQDQTCLCEAIALP